MAVKAARILRRAAAVLALLGTLAGSGLLAQVHIGLRLGHRTVFDEKIVEVYGEGFLYSPFLRLTSERTPLGLEIAYEGGFNREGTIGLYQESSTLKLQGLEATAIVRKRFGPVAPFLKAGIGYYFYKQVIESPDVRFKVDENLQQIVLGGGIDIRMPKGFYLTSEIKYVPLKVSPYGQIVDLGGIRFLAGLGFSFDVRPRGKVHVVD